MTTIPYGALKSCANVTAKESARFVLNCVQVHVDETSGAWRVEATDGRRLLRVETRTPLKNAKTWPIEAGHVTKTLKSKKWDHVKLYRSDAVPHSLTFVLADDSTGLVPIADGTFPELDQIIPKTHATKFEPYGINPELLAPLLSAMVYASGKPDGDYRPMRCEFNGKNSAIKMTIQTAELNITGVIMPVLLD